eukprot:scaffold27316_cov32-Tisochrysis_lutea.AAC.2
MTARCSFDQVVINKKNGLVAVELAEKQVAHLQKVRVFPRKQILNRPDLCSDHVSVEAVVRKRNGEKIRCATWNVADPWYFGRFIPQAALGFAKNDESLRLAQIRGHVSILLRRSDCVALQEVPHALAPFLEDDASQAGFGLRKSTLCPSKLDTDEDRNENCPLIMLFIRTEYAGTSDIDHV